MSSFPHPNTGTLVRSKHSTELVKQLPYFMAMADNKAPMQVALLASPGMGHLIPLGEFAKLLARDHGFYVTIFSASFGPPTPAHQAYIDSLPAAVTSVLLPPVQLHNLPDDIRAETCIFLTMAASVDYLRLGIKALAASSRVVALVVDLFSTAAFDVAKELGIRPYVFFPSNALNLSVFLRLPQLDQQIKGEYRELEEPVRLPGCVPLCGTDLVEPLQDRRNDVYRLLVQHCSHYMEADGIFVNSFESMEPGAIGGLKKGAKTIRFPPIYPVGPLIRTSPAATAEDGSECLKWLDEQPPGSVVFVSFGSVGKLSPEQMTELAMGLELSEQRFLWVVRSPRESKTGSFFAILSEKNPIDFLPEGFLRRTKGVGMVVPSWAPQAQVLAHPATGGIVSHCGWNSTLESAAHGVPMVAWPLYAEQRTNAVMLSEGIGVALRARGNDEGVVEREEVARVVREMMEGEGGKELRRRMRQLKESGAAAVRPGGSSHKAMSEAVSEWKMPVRKCNHTTTPNTVQRFC